MSVDKSQPEMNTGTSQNARKLIPKRLDEELQNVPRYKVGQPYLQKSDSYEKALYDEFVSPLVRKPSKPASNEADIVGLKENTLWIKRVEQLESENKDLRRKLAAALARQDELERENIAMATRDSSDAQKARQLAKDMKALNDDNIRMKNDLLEMHKFLADYGLTWVGNNEEEADSDETAHDRNEELLSVEESFALLQKLRARIDMLNAQAKAEPASVDLDGRRARFVRSAETMDTLLLAVYRNGILINRGPFRSIGSESYKSFVRDIMDGYYPYEYKDLYPEGVLFELVDKHAEVFSEDAIPKLSGQQLVSQLPKTVIRNGEIVSVRDSIESLVQPVNGSRKVSGIQWLAFPEEEGDARMAECLFRFVQPETTHYSVKEMRIQARCNSETTVFLIKQKLVNFMNDQFELEQRYGMRMMTDDVELRSGYPVRRLEEEDTAMSCGCVPKGVITVTIQYKPFPSHK